MAILRHLSSLNHLEARVLEVGIGDGENLGFLPRHWTVYGVDIARTQLLACRDRFPSDERKAGLGRGRAPALSGCDVRRLLLDRRLHLLTKIMPRPCARCAGSPGAAGPVVVADETPGMHRAGIGHLIGRPAIDRFWLRQLGLDAEFVDMVLQYDVDLRALDGQVWPDAAPTADLEPPGLLPDPSGPERSPRA